MHRIIILIAALCLFATSLSEGSSIEWIPPSHHQQYLTHALFIDQQTTCVARDGGRAWGGFGGAFTLAELPEIAGRPQFVISANIDTSFRVLGGPLDLRAETFDVRIGAGFDFSLGRDLRMSVGWMHLSGHAADGIQDPTLFPPNAGADLLVVRVVRDIDNRFRIGATVRPVIRSDPSTGLLDADQFAEWFPWGAADSPTISTPYLATSLTESGPDGLQFTWHVQVGLYYGSHIKAEHGTMVRFVLGYYQGVDPRLKLAWDAASHIHFPYLGFMLNI